MSKRKTNLVLTRKPGESIEINIGDGITLTVLSVKQSGVKLSLKAAYDVPIFRTEVDEQHGRRDSEIEQSGSDTTSTRMRRAV